MIYYSFDIETTGLDPKTHQMIEFAVIRDDGLRPIDELPSFRALLFYDNLVIDPFCAQLHQRLWEEMLDVKSKLKPRNLQKDVVYIYKDDEKNPDSFICHKYSSTNPPFYFATGRNVNCFMHFEPQTLAFAFNVWRSQFPDAKVKITPAGKNFSSFDKHWLSCIENIHHRSLDPGSMFADSFDTEIPSLPECMKRADLPLEGYHTALEDARMVCKLIRSAFSKKNPLHINGDNTDFYRFYLSNTLALCAATIIYGNDSQQADIIRNLMDQPAWHKLSNLQEDSLSALSAFVYKLEELENNPEVIQQIHNLLC